MSIQNSLNGLTATVATAAVASEHAKEKKEQKEEQGAFAKEQYHEASAALTKLEGESAEADKSLDKANKAVEATKG